jgi:hypothetical protein
MTPALDRELRRVHSLLLRNSSTLARLKAKYEEEEEDDDRRRRRRDAELWGDDDWD